MRGHLIYWGGGILAAALWWPSPLGGLLLAGAVIDAVAFRFGNPRRNVALMAGMLGIELVTILTLVAGVAGDRIDEFSYALLAGAWGLVRGMIAYRVRSTLEDLTNLWRLMMRELSPVAEAAVIGAGFVWLRGDLQDGLGLLIYGAIGVFQALVYDAPAVRRDLARIRVWALVVVGLVGWLLEVA
ncbi:hypothetical protein KQI63_15665 [bacterium]|nr:hypothetical protein [bacterium]